MKKLYANYIKRALDIVIAGVSIVLLSPVLIVLMVMVKVKLGSPVFFKQARPGRGEKIFYMYKFRTMTDERDESGKLLPDSARLTKFGKTLRKTSLDELPELFNILRGDMSIVGPRPQLVKDMVFMTPEQRRRHTVRQGLTGLAQVNGRNAIEWEMKLAYDVEYIKNITFINDMKIIIATIKAVLKSDGINAEGMATAEDYGDYLLKTGKIKQEEYNQKVLLSQKLIAKNL